MSSKGLFVSLKCVFVLLVVLLATCSAEQICLAQTATASVVSPCVINNQEPYSPDSIGYYAYGTWSQHPNAYEHDFVLIGITYYNSMSMPIGTYSEMVFSSPNTSSSPVNLTRSLSVNAYTIAAAHKPTGAVYADRSNTVFVQVGDDLLYAQDYWVSTKYMLWF